MGFTKFRNLILPLTAMTGTAALIYCCKIDKHRFLNEIAKIEMDEVQITNHCNRIWNSNWDKRQNATVKNGRTKHIILVRHGQDFDEEQDTQKILTQKGVVQSAITGHRLVNLGLPYTDLLVSTMTRAQQTGTIISSIFRDACLKVNVQDSYLIREGCPHPGSPPTKLEYRVEDRKRLDYAFKLYFHRADRSQTEDTCSVFVCHANVIRYLVCRALQLPEEAWTRFTLHHSSITWLSIKADGRVVLRNFGETGHIPEHLLTEHSEKIGYDI